MSNLTPEQIALKTVLKAKEVALLKYPFLANEHNVHWESYLSDTEMSLLEAQALATAAFYQDKIAEVEKQMQTERDSYADLLRSARQPAGLLRNSN
jgi:hypothetical protein